jgi:hypothetical protein
MKRLWGGVDARTDASQSLASDPVRRGLSRERRSILTLAADKSLNRERLSAGDPTTGCCSGGRLV